MVERGRKIHEEKRGETRGGKGERRMFTGVPSLPNNRRGLLSERLREQVR